MEEKNNKGLKMVKGVAVTGLGALCGLGNNVNKIWDNAVAGKSGISKLEHYNPENIAIDFGGEIKDFSCDEDVLAPKEAGRFDRFIPLALQATKEAISDAKIIVGETVDAEDIGCIFGVGMGGLREIELTRDTFINRGPRRVSPFFIPAIIPNMAPGLISLKFGLKGMNFHISSACASAAHAITSACNEILSGRQKVMVSGGSESVFSDIGIQGFLSMKALSKNGEDPTKASRPFDTGRDGFVMGEGAGVLILEDLDHAKARGAKIYAEIIGHGATSDALHITAPHPEGEGASRCMKMAIKSAGILPNQVDYINAHGTSTPLGDIAETMAIKKTFEEHAYNLNVSSTKSMTGHLLGAAGGIETIFCVKALEKGIIPPTINLVNQDPKCDLNYTANEAVEKDLSYVLNNSFGFGGTNSSIILKKH